VASEPFHIIIVVLLSIMPTQPAERKRGTDKHTVHRFFLGPLPERVLSDAQHLATKSTSGKEPRRLLSFIQTQRSLADDDEPINELINQYAYAFYLKLGGSEEDWSEEQEINVKDEMSRRWRDSAWGRLLRRKDGSNAYHARWVLPTETGFFQVGEFLGLNTYAEPAPRSPRFAATGSLSNRTDPSTSQVRLDDPSTTTRGDTFVTARSHISPALEPEPYAVPSQSSFPEGASLSPDTSYNIHAVTSTTSLLQVPAADSFHEREPEHASSGPTDVVYSPKPALRTRTLTHAKSDGALLPLDRVRARQRRLFVFLAILLPSLPRLRFWDVLQVRYQERARRQQKSFRLNQHLQCCWTYLTSIKTPR
jgi:hypothetical protein